MKKINLKNLFKNKNKLIDFKPVKVWPFPFAHDWKIIVLIFALVLISLSLFAWKIYLSDKIAAGYLEPDIESSNLIIKTIDQKRLEKALLILETKQSDYLKLKNSQTKLVDPAL